MTDSDREVMFWLSAIAQLDQQAGREFPLKMRIPPPLQPWRILKTPSYPLGSSAILESFEAPSFPFSALYGSVSAHTLRTVCGDVKSLIFTTSRLALMGVLSGEKAGGQSDVGVHAAP